MRNLRMQSNRVAIRKARTTLACCLLISAALAANAMGEEPVTFPDVAWEVRTPALPSVALPGQIIVDPQTPRWFVYNRDSDGDGKLDPFYLGGAGGPEDFFYRGTRNADGTRSGGDQQTIINALGASGVNGIYVEAVRSHGGDGDRRLTTRS